MKPQFEEPPCGGHSQKSVKANGAFSECLSLLGLVALSLGLGDLQASITIQ